MYSDLYSLENDLNCGSFAVTTTGYEVDAMKMIEALKCLTSRIHTMDGDIMANKTEIQSQQFKIEKLEQELEEYKYVFKKISKDYPEVVLAKPHIFAEEPG